MKTIALLTCLLIRSQINPEPDPLSSFRIRDEQHRGFRQVNILQAIQLAHSIQVLVNFPEDRVPRHYENSISIEESDLFISYRDRVAMSLTPQNGRLFAFNIYPPRQARAPNLSQEQCIAKAREFYHAVGGTLPLVLERSYLEKDPQYVHAVFKFAAPGTAYKFANGVETNIDRTYGTPHHMLISRPPLFEMPGSVVPRSIAIAQAASAAMQYTGWTAVQAASDDPTFRVPEFRRQPNRMREIEHRRVRERKAGLLYEVTVKDALAVVSEEKDRPFVWVHVDAESGEPIAIDPARWLIGGNTPANSRSFAWGQNDWSCGSAKGKVASSSQTSSASGKLVLLLSGRTYVKASFDKGSGLLWMDDKGQRVYGMPDKPLRRALEKAKPAKVLAMKKASN